MMKFKLRAPLGRYGDYVPEDMRDLKVALNHLGYYLPDGRANIDAMREPRIYQALLQFQRDKGIEKTDHLMPFDATVRALNAEVIAIDGAQRYIWRTELDERVRDEHAVREGEIFTFGFPPEGGHPGEDYNCRCHVELIDDPKEKYGPPDCREEEEALEEIEKILETLQKHKNELLEKLKKLVEQHGDITYEINTNIALQGLGFFLGVPNVSLDMIYEIVSRYFSAYISNIFLDEANRLIKKLNSVKQKISHVRDQIKIAEEKIKQSHSKRLETKEKLQSCREKGS